MTPREHQIVMLVRQGMTNKEIGCMLGISTETVKWNLKRMMRKHSLKNRAALASMVEES